MGYKLLIVNPGSTSTKIGVYEDEKELFVETLRHSTEEISKYDVAVNVHFTPLPMLSFFKSLGYDIKNYPTAYQNYKSEISLPIYPQMTDEMTDFVIETVKKAYNKIINKK